MAEFIYNFNFVGVPSDFIENVMPKANGAFVKVYLYALNLAAKGQSCDYGKIAEDLELLESDVNKAFEYLSEKGCLCVNDNTVVFGDNTSVGDSSSAKKSSVEDNSEKRRKIDFDISQNKDLSDLCQVAQIMLERTLSDKDIETLYWFYDTLGFSPEVITMLLEYCVSNEKRNMNYIEKVAIGWHENGINSISSAETYMREQKEKAGYFYNLRKLFGIDNRNLSKTEERFLKTWREDYKMSEEMVALAYEYCIIQINKLSFPYMNSIIERWHEKGIYTIPDAEKDKEEFKSSNGENDLNVYNAHTDFDYDSLEDIMQKKYDS